MVSANSESHPEDALIARSFGEKPPSPEGEPITLKSSRGDIPCLFHACVGSKAAVIWVGGTDGGFDGPADGIYGSLAEDLFHYGVSSLRLDFRSHRSPGIVAEGTFDVLRGIAFLREFGASDMGLVGHSFGAAVVITAAAVSPEAKTVITLSAQSAGTQLAGRISPRPILLIHGQDDIRLPPYCSEYIYELARQPKELVLLPDARHSLRQRRDQVYTLIKDWLLDKLRVGVAERPT